MRVKGKKNYTQNQIDAILNLRLVIGKSQREIAKLLGISQSTISYILRTRNIDRLPTWKSELDYHRDLILILHRTHSFIKISKALDFLYGIKPSPSTIKHYLGK